MLLTNIQQIQVNVKPADAGPWHQFIEEYKTTELFQRCFVQASINLLFQTIIIIWQLLNQMHKTEKYRNWWNSF